IKDTREIRAADWRVSYSTKKHGSTDGAQHRLWACDIQHTNKSLWLTAQKPGAKSQKLKAKGQGLICWQLIYHYPLMRPLKLLLPFLFFYSLSTLAQSPSFTLEQVMSSPFPTELTAAKQTARIAWVFELRGESNVWVADSPNFESRQ